MSSDKVLNFFLQFHYILKQGITKKPRSIAVALVNLSVNCFPEHRSQRLSPNYPDSLLWSFLNPLVPKDMPERFLDAKP